MTARTLSNPRGLSGPSPVMLNTTISTERRTSAVAGSGGVSVSYAANLSGVAASVQPGSTSEAIRIGAERGEQTYDVWVASGHDIVNTDRIVHGGVTMNIVGQQDM
ncbi:MAG: phage head completion protein, partial [Mycobacterium sp.]